MDREEIEAILEWMQGMRAAWKVTNGAINSLAQAQQNYQLGAWLQQTANAHVLAMDAAEQKLHARLGRQTSPLPDDN